MNKPTESNSSVYVDSLNAHYVVLDEESIYIKRSVEIIKTEIKQDVFGSGWVFMSGEVEEDRASIRLANGTIINIPRGCFSAYFPALSVVEWLLEPGQFEVEMITQMSLAPKEMPDYPMLYRQNKSGSIFDHLLGFSKNGVPKEAISIDRSCKDCHLSYRTYCYLVENFHEPITIGDIAKQFKTSPAVISRYFKKCYGYTPIEFLNQVRVRDSLGALLLKNRKVTDIAFDSGFNSVRVYNDNFSKYLSSRPSQFVPG